MRPATEIDLESLVLARNDGSAESVWWYDPDRGEALYYGLDEDDFDDDTSRRGLRVVQHEPQPATDVHDFVDRLDDDRLAAELLRAFRQRKGWRRFRDAVHRCGLGRQWQDFTLTRESVRALDWLLEEGLVEPVSAAARRAELVASEPTTITAVG